MSIIKYPLSTEKAIRMMESENKLTFIVDNDANKTEIATEIQKKFNIKITKINTFTDTKGRKKAYVRLSDETPALDVATKLGLM